MEYSRNVNVIPLLMEIGDRVQTLNTLCPISGEIVDMYKNLVTIADDDAETVENLRHSPSSEIISVIFCNNWDGAYHIREFPST